MSPGAHICGPPAEVLPTTLDDFRDSLRAQLAGPDLAVGSAARQVATTILRANVPPPLLPAVPAHRLSTAGVLPARLRRGYGRLWGPPAGGAPRPAARPFPLPGASPVCAR